LIPLKLYNSGPNLLAEIKGTVCSEKMIALWALGQAGFLLKSNKESIMFDPYLTDWIYDLSGEPWSRKFQTPIHPRDCEFVDYVVCSHHHEDHMDKLTLTEFKNFEQLKVIVPQAHLPLIKKWGIDASQLIGISHGAKLHLKEVTVEAFHAMHEHFEVDERGEHKYLGYLIEMNGVTVYFAGDTLVFPQLMKWLKRRKIDIALIPINGRDYARGQKGIIGNCNFREAADLAVAIGADLVIPMHYGMFPHNDENPAYFVDYLYTHYPQQKFHMMTPGERFIYIK
jgi:L-ascorbate 6-phosphate lactonase